MQAAISRYETLTNWLNTLYAEQDYQLTPLSGDASFRRYLRLVVGDENYMVMDAPPEKEKVTEFIQVAEFLSKQQVRVPKIMAKDEANGFIVLEDFGDDLLANWLNEGSVDALYEQAMRQIVQFQCIPEQDLLLPHYDAELLTREMALFTEWFLPYVNISLSAEKQALWESTTKQVVDAVLAQPQGFVHRDFHSRNLMVVETGADFGVIDFQDAVIGAHTYDLVSILRDVYVSWPPEKVAAWAVHFHELQQQAGLATSQSSADFAKDFDMMGVQRHLKILGIFVRLYERDGKAGYLPNLPQTMQYLLEECANLPALAEFNQWLCSEVLPAFIAQNPAEHEHLSGYVLS